VYPIVFVTCYVAVFATRQAFVDMVVMTAFGLLGFVMKRLDMSVPAFVIAFILGPGLERAMRQSFLLDESGAGIFLERPVALASFLLGALSLAFRLCGGSLHYRKQGHSRR
jgi:putative tricarboxylic transport membrane protein